MSFNYSWICPFSGCWYYCFNSCCFVQKTRAQPCWKARPFFHDGHPVVKTSKCFFLSPSLVCFQVTYSCPLQSSMLIYDLFISTCNIIMLTSNLIIFDVDINYKPRINIVMLRVELLYSILHFGDRRIASYGKEGNMCISIKKCSKFKSDVQICH